MNVIDQNQIAFQIADEIDSLFEFGKAFTAIEELMCPGAHSGDMVDLQYVGRDELATLIRVVNSAFKSRLSETLNTSKSFANVTKPQKGLRQ